MPNAGAVVPGQARSFVLAAMMLGAVPTAAHPIAPATQLHLRGGIERAEVDRVVAALKAAQVSLAEGSAYFHLLAGAPASYAANTRAPRDSFLALDWAKLRFAERIDARNYRLSVMPDGLGQLYWDVRVTLTVSGTIERVELFHGPPAPF